MRSFRESVCLASVSMNTQLEGPVPDPLLALARSSAAMAVRYMNELLEECRWSADDMAEWQRLAMYKTSDAISTLQLLLDTVSLYLRENGASDYTIARYRQEPESRVPRDFGTNAHDCLDGLLGRPSRTGEAEVWHHFAARLVKQDSRLRLAETEVLEVLMAAMYCSEAYDDDALAHLPERLRQRVRRVAAALADEPAAV